MKTKTCKEIKFEDGRVLEKGTRVEALPFGVNSNPSLCRVVVLDTVEGFDEVLTCRWTSIVKRPTERTLSNWICDVSPVKSVNGKDVDPDGYTCDGYPSWLLVLGMI